MVGCLQIGLTVADMDEYSTGELLDFITTYNNFLSEDDEVDIDFKFQQLKDIAPFVREQYQNGEIEEAEYKNFIDAIESYGGE